ncbi:DUF6458 family protein [Microbispora bryophytorum]|uniref:DUF6458 domain-containing protein n=2 Tax=Microbispora bryophytorum TaxID=1460882 RepID=A0A8H9LFS6_9ACTN|nr:MULTISPECIES: DUF6458 family protein [Microbispora]MBD3137944.1 hypothetical protein [Microbispora bryophytorum]MBD3141677.1 hypothetical protein [Microbispora camponoti]TQS05165.1 hypothetical protein FLX07_17835 [Microbispora bryophytorum]GGO22613.1 hypothetical protein GCM10011574_51120 [Microbispora bryophytorum]
MTIAGSIILIMLGAILTWAVDFTIAGLDIQVIGVILMVGGLAGLLFGIWRLTTVRRRTTVTAAAPVDAAATRRHVYEERRYDDPTI